MWLFEISFREQRKMDFIPSMYMRVSYIKGFYENGSGK